MAQISALDYATGVYSTTEANWTASGTASQDRPGTATATVKKTNIIDLHAYVRAQH